MIKAKKPIPFEFVLEELASLEPYTRPMFGCTSVYVGEKIVLILRDKGGRDPDNGIWIATTIEHHESLKKDLSIMRSIRLFSDGGPTGWQNLPAASKSFEENALKVCELIRQGDERVGKVPKRKKRRATTTRLTREDERSLAYHDAVAKILRRSSTAALKRARRNLNNMSEQNPGAKKLFDRWRGWLQLPVDELIGRILDPAPLARDMRQVSPFAGLLSSKERAKILSEFRKRYHR